MLWQLCKQSHSPVKDVYLSLLVVLYPQKSSRKFKNAEEMSALPRYSLCKQLLSQTEICYFTGKNVIAANQWNDELKQFFEAVLTAQS